MIKKQEIKFLLIISLSLTLFFTLSFISKTIITYFRTRIPQSWQVTKGKIEYVKLKLPWTFYLAEDNYYYDRDYYALIKFLYIVNNIKFNNSDKIEGPYISRFEHKTNEKLGAFYKKYPVGKEIDVYYNPNNPKKSKLLENFNFMSEIKTSLIGSLLMSGFLNLIILLSVLFSKSDKCDELLQT